MKFAAIVLVLFTSLTLLGEGSEALGRAQTDWYSRGIIRQQTINATTHQKKQKAQKKKQRKARTTRHRTSTKHRA